MWQSAFRGRAGVVQRHSEAIAALEGGETERAELARRFGAVLDKTTETNRAMSKFGRAQIFSFTSVSEHADGERRRSGVRSPKVHEDGVVVETFSDGHTRSAVNGNEGVRRRPSLKNKKKEGSALRPDLQIRLHLRQPAIHQPLDADTDPLEGYIILVIPY